MILVTGGAGFIGSNFVLDWLAEIGEPLVKAQDVGAGQARAALPRASRIAR